MNEILWNGDNVADITNELGPALRYTELNPKTWDLTLKTSRSTVNVTLGQTVRHYGAGIIKVL